MNDKIIGIMGMILGGGILMACGDGVDTHSNTNADTIADNSPSLTLPSSTTPAPHQSDKITINLDEINSHTTPIDPSEYHYPFAIDSLAVQNYAQAYHISNDKARHSMVLAMASPEVLGKVLDQMEGEYLGHSLTDGAQMSLVIYTTDRVNPSEFIYIFADKFAEGLALPVKIQPKTHGDVLQVDMSQKRHSS